MTSSLIGFFQEDIKKIIAYSTMSQLGMMVLAIGLSSYNISLFHLINHAFYKALLFLGAGSVIHAVHDNQDLRKYGGLKIFLPLSYTIMLIASLSLMALPFMSGFYSKDFILESAYGQFYFSSKVIYFLALIGATFTALYSIKVLYLTFISAPNGYLTDYKKAHEGDIYMSLPLIILSVFSILFGFVTKDMFIGMGSGFFSDNAIFIHPIHEIMLETEFALPSTIKVLPLIMTIFSFIYYNGYVNKTVVYLFIASILLYIINIFDINIIENSFMIYGIIMIASLYIFKLLNIIYKNVNIINKISTYIILYIGIIFKFNTLIDFDKISINLTNFFNQRLYFELFYNKFISEKFLNLGGQTTKVLDKGSIEYIGPYGLENGLNSIGKEISKLDSGKINSYALYILTGFVVYIFILNSLFMDELILVIYMGMMFININSKKTS
jgi:NADH:ubiquinone oxidoreductase subunit 5 (subunit L)/multisubunit Na+/H+ antiporter MnhA subunit